MRRPDLRIVWAIALSALLCLPSERSRPTATGSATAMLQGGQARVNFGAGFYGRFREQLLGFAERAEALVNQIDDFYPSKAYCTAAERAADEAKLRALQAAYDALNKDYTTFKQTTDSQVQYAFVQAQFPEGDKPGDPHFWDNADNEILKAPRAALNLKQREFSASKVIDCSQPATTPPPPPVPPPPPPRVDPLGGLRRPEVPDFKLPTPPPFFCSLEAEIDWINKNINPLFRQMMDVLTALRDYGGDVYFLPKSDDPAVNKIRDDEQKWAHAEHEKLGAMVDALLALRRSLKVINCEETRIGLGTSPPPAPPGSGSMVVHGAPGSSTAPPPPAGTTPTPPSGSSTTPPAGTSPPRSTGSSATPDTSGMDNYDFAPDAPSGSPNLPEGFEVLPPEAFNLGAGSRDSGPQIFNGTIAITIVPGFSPLAPLRPASLLESLLGLLEPAVLAREQKPALSISPLHVFVVSLGTATGDAFDAHIINDGDRDASVKADGVVLEPVGRDRQDRVRKAMQDAVEARGPRAPAPTVVRIRGYCLQYTKQPPVQGTIFQFADTETQLQQADLRHVLRTEEALERQGVFTPTMDPKTFFDILRQWSIWVSAQKFSAQDFAREFVDHARKNILAAHQPWNATVEAQIRSSVPQWWQDVSRVLSESAKGRSHGPVP